MNQESQTRRDSNSLAEYFLHNLSEIGVLDRIEDNPLSILWKTSGLKSFTFLYD